VAGDDLTPADIGVWSEHAEDDNPEDKSRGQTGPADVRLFEPVHRSAISRPAPARPAKYPRQNPRSRSSNAGGAAGAK